MQRTLNNFRCVKAFARDDDGSVAILFGLLIIVLFGLAGGAVDYSRAVDAKSRLQQAVDSAVLAAARDPYASEAQIKAVATAYLNANTESMLGSDVSSVSITRTSGATAEVTVTANSASPTTMLSLFGIQKMDIKATSTAGVDLGETEIYAAIDMSESMGIAADDAARTAMQNLTAPYTGATANPEGCMFGCHMRDGWEPPGETVYSMAKAAGIPMREDVLHSAFGAFVDNFMPAGDQAVAENRKRMSIIGFSDDAKVLQSPTNDVSEIKAAPAKFPDPQRNNTVFKTALPKIRDIMGPQGDGMGGKPRKTLLLVTDGLAWIRSSSDPDNGPMNAALCDSFKNDGIVVAVIEVKYQEAAGEHWFETLVAGKYADISPALESCASPGFYFQATDSDTASLAEAFTKAGISLHTALALKN